jgi:hypothetical protein
MKIHFRPLPILSAFLVIIGAFALLGCEPKEPSTKTMAARVGVSGSGAKTSDTGSGALPSMSSYTLEKSEGALTSKGATDGSSVDGSGKANRLPPGQYCFHKAGNQNWLSIRLQVAENQQITGESAGTVHHPQQGETRYRQAFVGEMVGDQAQVEVTTSIAEVTQSRPEAWIVSLEQLDMGRVVIEKATCPEISADF